LAQFATARAPTPSPWVLARAEDEARFMSEAREALRLYEAKGNAASAAAMVASLEARSRS
jgi:hypothetical protein